MCSAEQDGDDEGSLLVGRPGEVQRGEGFQQAEMWAAVQVEEIAQQREVRSGSGEVELDPQISGGITEDTPVSTQRGGSFLCSNAGLPTTSYTTLFSVRFQLQTHPLKCLTTPI